MKEYEKTPYGQSRLKDWLAKDSWSVREAVCLLSDVDPTGAVIDWDGYTNSYGGRLDLPIIKHGQLLSEGTDIAFSESWERVLDVTSTYDDEPFFDADKLTSGPSHESQRMSLRIDAERQVRRAWDLYRRNPKHSDDDNRLPHEFISWGKAQELNIPWLDWAEHNGYLFQDPKSGRPKSKETPAEPVKKATSTKVPERDNEKKQEIVELRAKAKTVAVKLKRDGIHPKRITVERVCRELLKENFSTGKPLASRWRTIDGMRSYLKGEHHPKNNEEFRNAKSDRAKFNPSK